MRSWFRLLTVGLAMSSAGVAVAQVIEVPRFEVARPTLEERIGTVDVDVGTDGNLLFLWSEWRSGISNPTKALTRLVSPAGVALGPPTRVDLHQHVSEPVVRSDSRGAYLAAWEEGTNSQHEANGRLLSPTGVGIGDEIEVTSPDNPSRVFSVAVAALASGSVFLWQTLNDGLLGRLYDVSGNPRGAQFQVSEPDQGTWFFVDADSMPDGGFVTAWQSSFGDSKTRARVYRADGQPRGPVLLVDPTVLSDVRVAASPTGGFALAGTHWNGVDTTDLWVRRFTDDGVLMWETLVHQPPPNVTVRPDLAFDALGNVYVAWSSYGGDTPFSNYPRARGLDAGGVPLGGSVEIDDQEYPTAVRVARLANGTSFVTAWNGFGFSVDATVVALCGPGSSVCGDGNVDPHCEQCDLGAGNDDTTSNTCRTNCRRAHCGDGVLDDHEQCDDGDVVSCDGCSAICELEVGHVCGDGILDPTCNEECDAGPANGDVADSCRTTCTLPRCGDGIADNGEQCDDGNLAGCDGCTPGCVVETGLVCGDGVAEAGCGESCDDGNITAGDGCSPQCVAERIPGGGQPATDCYIAWSLQNPGNVPYFDTHGAISSRQSCTDDDPRCDVDGGVPGACTFNARVCGNNTDQAVCAAPLRVASWELRTPSATQASHDAAAAEVRAAFMATVPGAIVGPTARDICSPFANVRVNLRGKPGAYKATKLKLKSRALAYDGSQDTDQLTLICVPATL